MSRGYQRKDGDLIDYDLYELRGVHGTFRGPPVPQSSIASGDYIACLGAAQTFGRFVANPYPALLSEALGIPALNLGRGGAGPGFPVSSPALLDYINGARLVVIQAFSGRSQSNSLFQTVNHGMKGINVATGRDATADEFYTWLLTEAPGQAHKVVAETRENYTEAMTHLLRAIVRPKVLLWFSVRSPEYEQRFELPLECVWGEFPHFVDRSMVDVLKEECGAYVECVSRLGLPQPLRVDVDNSARPEGVADAALKREPLTHNHYYPSPEMHRAAAGMLLPVCRQLFAQTEPASVAD